jgi:hypothetical protein
LVDAIRTGQGGTVTVRFRPEWRPRLRADIESILATFGGTAGFLAEDPPPIIGDGYADLGMDALLLSTEKDLD